MSLKPGLQNLAAANADNGGRGVGAAWDFEVAGGVLVRPWRSLSRK